MAHLSPPAEQPICVWTDASRKFAIHIHPDVIGRLATDAWVAFKRVPRRGLEIGGILLGQIECQDDVTNFRVKGFEPVESEHRSGPSYVLSESDFGHLQDALIKNGTSSIGVYRSQTRSERLELQDTDDHLFQQAFAASDALFLILAAVSRTAAFFVRADGMLKCVHEFALTSSLSTIVTVHECHTLPEVKAPGPLPPDTHAVPAMVVEPVDSPPQEAPRASRRTVVQPLLRSKKLAWKVPYGWSIPQKDWLLVLAITSVILSATIGVLSYSLRHSPVPNLPTHQYLPLTVKRAGAALELVWDDSDSALQGATRAVLHIRDGDQQSDRSLGIADLTAGSILYEPKNADVAFRMDVYSAEPNASGSVQVMNLAPRPGPASSLAARAVLKSEKPLRIVPMAQPAGTPAELRSVYPAKLIAEPIKTEHESNEVPSTAGRSSYGSETDLASPRTVPAAVTPASPERASEIADTGPATRPVAPRSLPVDRPAAVPLSGQQPSIWVSTEPLSGSVLGQVVGKIPLVRRFRKPVKTRMTVDEAQPVLSVSDKQELIRPVSVDIKVFVENSGKVSNAQIVEYGNPPSWKLANAALAASRRWTFEPVRAGDTTNADELILHFRFSP
jgi:hypothetical protein